MKSRLLSCLAATALGAAMAVAMPAMGLDGDNGGGRRCSGLSSQASIDPSAFPQPAVRRSSHGVLIASRPCLV
jgi:hypothetical protein